MSRAISRKLKAKIDSPLLSACLVLVRICAFIDFHPSSLTFAFAHYRAIGGPYRHSNQLLDQHTQDEAIASSRLHISGIADWKRLQKELANSALHPNATNGRHSRACAYKKGTLCNRQAVPESFRQPFSFLLRLRPLRQPIG